MHQHLGLELCLLDGGRVGTHYFCCRNGSESFSQGRGNAKLKLVLAQCVSLLWRGFNCNAASGDGVAYFLMGGCYALLFSVGTTVNHLHWGMLYCCLCITY